LAHEGVVALDVTVPFVNLTPTNALAASALSWGSWTATWWQETLIVLGIFAICIVVGFSLGALLWRLTDPRKGQR
jgi:hypothetical protein